MAFVLALAGPVLRRLRISTRWAVTLALLAGFGLVTRFEPSVMRACAMAAVACTASGLGRSVPRLRVLWPRPTPSRHVGAEGPGHVLEHWPTGTRPLCYGVAPLDQLAVDSAPSCSARHRTSIARRFS